MRPTAYRSALGAVAHKTVNVDLRSIGGSALTDDIAVPTDADGHAVGNAAEKNAIPVTYVPARNTIMLSVALGWAEVLGAADIFCGVNAVDYSGYPDCRPEFIDAFQSLANLATKAGVEGAGIRVHAPLQFLSKADIVREGLRLGRRFRRNRLVLPGRRSGPRLRPLRRLPPARRRLCRGRRARPDALRLNGWPHQPCSGQLHCVRMRTPAQRRPGQHTAGSQPGSLAQSVEHRTFNPLVDGSNPSRPTKQSRANPG